MPMASFDPDALPLAEHTLRARRGSGRFGVRASEGVIL